MLLHMILLSIITFVAEAGNRDEAITGNLYFSFMIHALLKADLGE